ncbi:MAG: hypothetical protein QM776_02950 [Rhodocyclaceae bacterium]
MRLNLPGSHGVAFSGGGEHGGEVVDHGRADFLHQLEQGRRVGDVEVDGHIAPDVAVKDIVLAVALLQRWHEDLAYLAIAAGHQNALLYLHGNSP